MHANGNRDEALSIRAVNNTNNGGAFFHVWSEKANSGACIGGLFGIIPNDQHCSVTLENNTNNGLIEGSFGTIESLQIGGLIGQLTSKGKLIMNENTNNGNITIEGSDIHTSPLSYNYVAGIVGLFANHNKIVMKDHSNFGRIASNFTRNQTFACGIICAPTEEIEGTTLSLQNCMNNGIVEGPFAYGISSFVTMANNIVNIGVTNGTQRAFSFWETVNNTANSLYGLNDTCVNCDDNIVLIAKDKKDKQYHTLNGDQDLVTKMLNEEAAKNEYNLMWDCNLYLRTPIAIHICSPLNKDVKVVRGLSFEESGVSDDIFEYHLMEKGTNPSAIHEFKKNTIINEVVELEPYYMVVISGEIDKTIYVKVDGRHNLGDCSNELKEFFESERYAVGDLNSNTVLKAGSTVTGDLAVVVIPRHTVVIDIEKSTLLAVDVDASVFAESIRALTGIQTNNILIELEVDSEGYVLQVVVILKDNEMGEVLVNAVNGLPKDKQCSYGQLCRCVKARVIEETISVAGRNEIQRIQICLILFLLFASLQLVF